MKIEAAPGPLPQVCGIFTGYESARVGVYTSMYIYLYIYTHFNYVSIYPSIEYININIDAHIMSMAQVREVQIWESEAMKAPKFARSAAIRR